MKTLMKITFFFAYHIFVFGLILWVGFVFISPYFTQEWWTGFNWLRKTIIVITQASLLGYFVWSVLSCFSKKKLTATQIGQWSVSEWMPYWGRNEENSWYGLFLGLPSWMVTIKAVTALSEVTTETKQIQVEKDGDPNGRKFAADFKFSFQTRVINTWISIKKPNTKEDMVNLVIARLTQWLNDPSHKYANITQLKTDKVRIEYDTIESVGYESFELYGDQIVSFKLISIELPQGQIEQQNKDAAARDAQRETDDREAANLKNFQQKVADHIALIKATTGETMSWTRASDEVMLLEGITKKETKKYTGKGKPAAVIDDSH